MAGPDPDQHLVRELSSNDPAARRRALARLYERYQRRVLNVAWRVIGDWASAQDVTQEVFLDLGRRIGSFRGESGLSSWIYRVAVNRAIDTRRHERRRPAWSMDHLPADDSARRPDGQSTSVPGLPVDDGRSDRVHEAMRRLSPKHRAILVLRYLEGLSYEELVEVLGCSMGTVKSRLNRAHAAIRAELLSLGEDDRVN